MFEKLEGLDPKQHADLKLKNVDKYHFVSQTHLLPLVASEAGLVAKHYPIVFIEGEKILPQIVCALQQGKNTYVDDEGNWRVGYVPAAVRRYPFVLGQTKNPDEFAVMIDRNAPHFSETEGQPLFDKDQQLTEPVQKIIGFLNQIQKDSKTTLELCQQLKEHDVLEPRPLELRKTNAQEGEKPLRVSGFLFVNREKLKALDPSVLKEWVGNGLMEFIYLHLNSLSNIQDLALAITTT